MLIQGWIEPGLVTFYDIQPGNGAAVYFFNPEPTRAVTTVMKITSDVSPF